LVAAVGGLGFTLAGFLAGWIISRHVVVSETERPPRLPHARGDASEAVRAEVLQALREFQDGYTRRDPNAIGPFMERLFLPGSDQIVLGTEGGEWNVGPKRIGDFIRDDWKNWGDVKLDLDAPMISSSGNVAWVVTPGDVTFGRVRRAFRFTATLVKSNGHWLFRQVQFQWEIEAGSSLRELLNPSNFHRLRWR
jgi:hypothetical protein